MHSPLLCLPYELLQEILSYVLIAQDEPVHFKFNGQFYLGGPLLHRSRHHLAILRTCYTLKRRGLQIFLRSNTFLCNEPKQSCPPGCFSNQRQEEKAPRPNIYDFFPIRRSDGTWKITSPMPKPDEYMDDWMYDDHTRYTIDENEGHIDTGGEEDPEEELLRPNFCKAPIHPSWLQFLRHVGILIPDRWPEFLPDNAPASSFSHLIRASVLLETLAAYKTHLVTLFVLYENEGFVAPRLFSEPPSISLALVRPLVPAIKTLVHKAPIKRVDICGFAVVNPPALFCIDHAFHFWLSILNGSRHKIINAQDSSFAPGLFVSLICHVSVRQKMSEAAGLEGIFTVRMPRDWRDKASKQTLARTEHFIVYHKRAAHFGKTWKAWRSAPQEAIIEDRDLENFDITYDPVLWSDHELRELFGFIKNPTFPHDIWSLCDAPQDERDELDWEKEKRVSKFREVTGLDDLDMVGEEDSIARHALTRMALDEVAASRDQTKITQFFKRDQRKITEFFKPVC